MRSTTAQTTARATASDNAVDRLALILSLIATTALLLVAAPASAEVDWQQLQQRVESAGLSRVDASLSACPSSIDVNRADRTVLQVIELERYSWREFDLADGSTCVLLIEPQVEALSAERAETLLQASNLWTVPAGAQSLTAAASAPRSPRSRHSDAKPLLEKRDLATVASQSMRAPSGESVRHRADREAVKRSSADATSEIQRATAPLVFGGDDRERVRNTSDFPFATVTYVESAFPDGSILGFSGVLIAPNTVLTSALAVHQTALGGWADDALVVPGQSQVREGANIEEPFGSQFATAFEVPQEWFDSEELTAIYGAIFLDAPFAGITTFMPLVFGASPAGLVNMAGYDQQAQGESDSFAQWTRNGPVTSIDSDFLFYRLDDDGGAIGAPVWELLANNSRRIVAINCCVASDDSANAGLRLTSNNQSLIEEWLDSDPGSNPGPPLGTGNPLFIGGQSADQFRVTVDWLDADSNAGTGEPFELTRDTGYFYFFNADNVEVVVKVVDGCGINNRYWVFAGGLTDLEIDIIIEDTATGDRRQYNSPLGQGFQTVRDTDAFSSCP